MTEPLLRLELLSNLSSDSTGVSGAVIWVSAGEFTDQDLGPRATVVLGTSLSPARLGESASILLTDPPRVLGELPEGITEQALGFVTRNRLALLRYWTNETSTPEMIAQLTKGI